MGILNCTVDWPQRHGGAVAGPGPLRALAAKSACNA